MVLAPRRAGKYLVGLWGAMRRGKQAASPWCAYLCSHTYPALGLMAALHSGLLIAPHRGRSLTFTVTRGERCGRIGLQHTFVLALLTPTRVRGHQCRSGSTCPSTLGSVIHAGTLSTRSVG